MLITTGSYHEADLRRLGEWWIRSVGNGHIYQHGADEINFIFSTSLTMDNFIIR